MSRGVLSCFDLDVDSAERVPVSRWSARSAARTNDLEAGEGPPHTRSEEGGRGQRRGGSSHVGLPCESIVGGDASGVPAPSLIWVHGLGSGDMMMDGVPGVRAGDGCGRSFFPGRPPGVWVAAGTLLELAAGIS